MEENGVYQKKKAEGKSFRFLLPPLILTS